MHGCVPVGSHEACLPTMGQPLGERWKKKLENRERQATVKSPEDLEIEALLSIRNKAMLSNKRV